MLTRLTSLLITLTLSSVSAESPQKHYIDTWLEKQMDNDFSTFGMMRHYEKANAMWDKEMNQTYSSLIKELPPEKAKDLKEAQRAWIKFRDANYKALGSIVADKEGSAWRVIAANLHYETVKHRAVQLEGFGASFEDDEQSDPASAHITHPKRGSQTRKDICNAFRVPMKKHVGGQKVVFVIHRLTQLEDWAFITCSLLQPNGKEINWSKPPPRSARQRRRYRELRLRIAPQSKRPMDRHRIHLQHNRCPIHDLA